MKYINILLLLITLLFLSGCSSSKETVFSPSKGLEPSVVPPSVTNAPSSMPTKEPLLTSTPTEVPISEDITPDPNNNSTALQLLDNMSLEEKVGQMFFVTRYRITAVSIPVSWKCVWHSGI